MANQMTDDRRKRIQRLKKIIILFMLILLLIPIILCMILFNRMQKQQQQMDALREIIASGQSANESYDAVREEAEDRTVVSRLEAAPVSAVGESGTSEADISDEECRKVYLTFDDGPSRYTDDILDILAQYNVKATFFVVGKTDESSLAAYQRIVEEGHTLGMHSYSHKYDEIYQSVETYAQDLGRLQEFLYETTGVLSRYVRFPGGSSNKVSTVAIRDLIVYLEEQGIRYYDWNISSGDAAHGYVSAETIKENILPNVEKHDTVIILMHDAADKETTVEALPAVIEGLLAMENTKILAIDDETVPVQHIKVTE